MGAVNSAFESLREYGVALVRGAIPPMVLAPLKKSAEACFESLEGSQTRTPPARYGFTPFSHSVLMDALLDFGTNSRDELLAPVLDSAILDLLTASTGASLVCRFDASWLRKRFSLQRAPVLYRSNSWHQDGALGVAQSCRGDAPAPLALITCWIPLHDAGQDCPGLEIIRQPLDYLLHYTELDDRDLRKRFDARPVLGARASMW